VPVPQDNPPERDLRENITGRLLRTRSNVNYNYNTKRRATQ